MAELIAEAARLGLVWGRADGVTVPRAVFVAEVRTWLRTRFQHQGEARGIAVDCGGLIRGASVALGLLPTDYQQRMPESVRGYARQRHDDAGEQLCDHYWSRIPIDAAQIGDVVICAWRGAPPQHAAVLADYTGGGLSLVHALRGQGVVEHRLDDNWRSRIVAAYSIPGVE